MTSSNQQQIKSGTYQILKVYSTHLGLSSDCDPDGTIGGFRGPTSLANHCGGNLVLLAVEHVVTNCVCHIYTLDVLEFYSQVYS